MTTQARAGVTASEFTVLCQKHWRHSSLFPSSSVPEFLERCREAGLVTRHVGDQGRVEYVPTDWLLAAFYEG